MDLKAAMVHTRKAMAPIFGHVFIYEHCLQFDVSRAFDEAIEIKNPRIWATECEKNVECASGVKRACEFRFRREARPQTSF